MPVPLLADLEQAGGVAMGQVALLENIRFFTGEKSDADELAQRMAAICDVFVMDAPAQRIEPKLQPMGWQSSRQRFARLLLDAELRAIKRALAQPVRPMVAIIGGAKVSPN